MVKEYLKNECYAWTFVLLLDSIVNVNKKYYPLVFSNECKCIVSQEKIKIMSATDEKSIIDDSDDEEYKNFD